MTDWRGRVRTLLDTYRIGMPDPREVRAALEAFQGFLEARDLAQRMRGRPRWVNNCGKCEFKGSLGRFDVYECVQGHEGGMPPIVRNSSLIARYGSDGPDYASAPRHVFAGIVHDTIVGKVLDGASGAVVWTVPDWMGAILRVVFLEPEE